MKRWPAGIGPAKIRLAGGYSADVANEPRREIVGVVGDVRQDLLDREIQPQIYIPYLQQPALSQAEGLGSRFTMSFVVRSAGEPKRLIKVLRTAVADVDVPIFKIKTLDELMVEQLWQTRQTAMLLASSAPSP